MGHCVVLGKNSNSNFNIHNINEVKVQLYNICLFYSLINKLLSADNKVPKPLFEARKVARCTIYKVNLCCPLRQRQFVN